MHLQTQTAAGFKAPPGPGWRTRSWVLLTAIASSALVLALAGGRGSAWPRIEDALGLFPSGFPEHKDTVGRSAAFIAAMYLAPIVALWVTATLILTAYARRLSEFRARWRRGHTVVCGLGDKGLRSARMFRREGERVTCIELEESDAAYDMRARGAIVLRGDAADRHLLRVAAVHRAKNVVCACLEDSTNASIAAQVEQLVRGRSGARVNVYVHIGNPELSGSLPTLDIDTVNLEFFNIYDLWAQALADQAELAEVERAGGRPHVVVVGSTGLARSLVVWVARRWHSLRADRDRRIRITLIAADASDQCGALARRYPALARTTELSPVDHAASSANPIELSSIADPGAGATIYMCLFDDGENLGLALQARRRLPSDARVIVPATAWTAELAPLLLGSGYELVSVGYSDDEESFDVRVSSMRELMAREIHAAYLEGGATGPAATAWETLDEPYREANREQVDGMNNAFDALWYFVEPLPDWDREPPQLSNHEIETLAELEHARWCEERRGSGWHFGERDDRARTHPDLVPWNELSPEAKEKDRDAVSEWPQILARAGYTLERSPLREALARSIHERHRRERAAVGEGQADNSLLVPWAELSDGDRESSRASADDIGLKLARIGCRPVPKRASAQAFALTDAEIELLAEREHERWADHKRDEGWTSGGTRSDTAKVHPDIVAWAELPEDRREIDRSHVRAIPGLLDAVGLAVIRQPLGTASG
jgi:hypothetical protein